MNVKDLMSLGGNLNVSVNLDDLRIWHDELVATAGMKHHPIEKLPNSGGTIDPQRGVENA
ncbi:hypothetical protein EZS27_013712 [termite gut metagenome]|uniref:Uncharacterized protein n=1 Tax=termite gut metagenome TaxID=433724 RepID=A0A5J4RWZ4_9ZZZZ